MALKGIESTKAALRATKLVYWRIFENARTKGAGSFIATSNFDDADLTQDESYRDLSEALDRLGGGRYVLMGYKKNTTHGGAQFESEFEVIPDYNRSTSTISGTSEFYVEGIGKITPENFLDAVDKKIKDQLQKQQEEKELADLKAKIKQLESDAKENDGTINKGLLAIGTVLYPMVSKSPHFKEVFSMVSGVMKQANNAAAPVANALGSTTTPAASAAAEHVEGDTCEIGGTKVQQDELFKTLDELGTDNPEVLQHLKILAGLKKNNPAMYNEAVEMAQNL
jgi:hypothetical protein